GDLAGEPVEPGGRVLEHVDRSEPGGDRLDEAGQRVTVGDIGGEPGGLDAIRGEFLGEGGQARLVAGHQGHLEPLAAEPAGGRTAHARACPENGDGLSHAVPFVNLTISSSSTQASDNMTVSSSY